MTSASGTLEDQDEEDPEEVLSNLKLTVQQEERHHAAVRPTRLHRKPGRRSRRPPDEPRGPGRCARRGAAGAARHRGGLADAPLLTDFFALRFDRTRNHCLQSANKALQRGADEEIILACLLHDTSQELLRAEHGYWGAQLYEPYVPARTAFAIRNHQPLRFFADTKAGYEYPDLYKQMYGEDYVPEPHVQAAYEATRRHRWYDAAREVTVSDLYAFDPKAVVTIEPFTDIIGRHFKQPKAGLGRDGSPVAHMWRTLANPDAPL